MALLKEESTKVTQGSLGYKLTLVCFMMIYTQDF